MKKIISVLLSLSVMSCTGGGQKPSTPEAGASERQVPDQKPFNRVANGTLVPGVLTLSGQHLVAGEGELVCMDVTVADFNQIISMQYTLSWDPEILSFNALKGFRLPDLGPNNYGTHRTAEGLLTFVWIHNSLKGVNLPDGSSIYQVCFTAAGKSGQISPFEFIESPTPFEVVNVKEEVLQLNGIGGSVTMR